MTEMKEKPKIINRQCHFDPVAHGLNKDFRLTRFMYVENRERKIPSHNTKYMDKFIPRTNVSLNSLITQDGERITVQTTGVILPFLNEPYVMGRIAGANVFGELYAIGITNCDSMLMLLSVSTVMMNKERDVVLPFITKGLRDSATRAETAVKGRHIIVAPSCTIGAVLSSVCQHDRYISPSNALSQDVLILTKPLGTHMAVNAFQVQEDQARGFLVVEDDTRELYQHAVDSMTRLNLTASRLMHKYNAHAAVNVGELGILGHASKLASRQANHVSFVIHSLPVFAKMPITEDAGFDLLMSGLSRETSGGLLVCLSPDNVNAYLEDFKKFEGHMAWVVGYVEKGTRSALIIENPTVIPVPFLRNAKYNL